MRDTQVNQPSAGGSVNEDSRPASSTADAVFAAILADIVSGKYPHGARLPAERELARVLGASRPTLREVLRRLTEWCLIAPRRGSGIVIRPPSEWSIEVLPAYVRFAGKNSLDLPIVQLMVDMLALRRSLLVEIIGLVCGRTSPDGLAAARSLLDHAYAERAHPLRFLAADLAVIRQVALAARFFPAVWLLNRLASVYLELAGSLAGAISPPHDYHEVHSQVFDALEAGDRGQAVTIMRDYLVRHDRRLLGAAMPVDPSGPGDSR